MGLYSRVFMDIEDAAWKECAEELGYPPGAFSDDQSRRKLLGEEKRQVSLTLLKIFAKMSEALELSSFKAETDALMSGATYAEIATSRGVSRQAVRQRRKRHLESLKLRKVILVGGPYNGEESKVMTADKAIRKTVSVNRLRYLDDDPVEWIARYEQSREDDGHFVFVAIEEVARTDV